MITDEYLENLAKAAAQETATFPNYQAVATTEVTSIDPTDTELSGEIGTRGSLTTSRTENVVEWSFIRSGATVIDTTNGDDIKSVGVFNTDTQSTSDPLQIGVAVSGVTQTTAFDIEIITSITHGRA